MSREILRAILKNDIKKLDLLLSEGENIMETTHNEKWSYLHRALLSIAMPPSTEMIESLLKRGLDINAIDVYGNAPIHYAAILKKSNLIELLVKEGADINVVNIEGVSPLKQLLLSKPYDYASMRILIHANADIDQSLKEFVKITSNGDQELLSIFDMNK